MTYNVGDDATITYPVTDTNGGSLNLPATVVAHTSAGDELPITAAWQGAAAAHPDIEGATLRQLDVPLETLPAGLWGLVLVVEGEADLFLGNVVIQ